MDYEFEAVPALIRGQNYYPNLKVKYNVTKDRVIGIEIILGPAPFSNTEKSFNVKLYDNGTFFLNVGNSGHKVKFLHKTG